MHNEQKREVEKKLVPPFISKVFYIFCVEKYSNISREAKFGDWNSSIKNQIVYTILKVAEN